METLAYNRLRSRRYVRARARGLGRKVAARAAGYHEEGVSRIERRLKGEIEQERRKLARINGHVPGTHSRRDAPRILASELMRLATYFGPNAERLEQQSLRALAQQITPSDARTYLARIERELHREAKNGGATVRTLKRRELCRQLIVEIGAYRAPPGSREAGAPQAEPQAAVPAEPPRCRDHPSQPAFDCKLCAMNVVRRWREQDARQPASDDGLYREPPLPPWAGR